MAVLIAIGICVAILAAASKNGRERGDEIGGYRVRRKSADESE